METSCASLRRQIGRPSRLCPCSGVHAFEGRSCGDCDSTTLVDDGNGGATCNHDAKVDPGEAATMAMTSRQTLRHPCSSVMPLSRRCTCRTSIAPVRAPRDWGLSHRLDWIPRTFRSLTRLTLLRPIGAKTRHTRWPGLMMADSLLASGGFGCRCSLPRQAPPQAQERR